jgi:phenol 2-monooxygenase
MRVCDANTVHLGHHHLADGRWRPYASTPLRLYASNDEARLGDPSALTDWATWLATSTDSPLHRFTPAGADINHICDVKIIAQQPHTEVDLGAVPRVFLPRTGKFDLTDYELVYSALPGEDIFEARGLFLISCGPSEHDLRHGRTPEG